MSNYKLCKLDGSHDFDFACSLSKKKCCSRKALFAKNNENATRESQECDAGITVLVTASFLKIFFAGNTFSDSDQLIEQNERNYRADNYSPASIRTTETVSTVDADDIMMVIIVRPLVWLTTTLYPAVQWLRKLSLSIIVDDEHHVIYPC